VDVVAAVVVVPDAAVAVVEGEVVTL